MPRRALVTGGAGFIGSHLSEGLLKRGWDVVVLDDLSTGLASNVPPNAALIEGSILSQEALAAAINSVDTVFHLAASVSVPYSLENPEESVTANGMGTFDVLEAARGAGVKRFVYSSSSAAYGDGPESPKTEDLAPMPLSPYAAGKLAGEHLVSSYAHSFGMETVSLRYFNVFGPRQRPDSPYAAVIPIFLSRIAENKPLTVYGDGEQTRDFTFIENVVNANLLAAERAGLKGEVVNIACGEEVSLNQLIKEIAVVTGKRPEVRYEPPRLGEVVKSVASISRAKELLGYECAVGWQEGLRRTVSTGLSASPN